MGGVTRSCVRHATGLPRAEKTAPQPHEERRRYTRAPESRPGSSAPRRPRTNHHHSHEACWPRQTPLPYRAAVPATTAWQRSPSAPRRAVDDLQKRCARESAFHATPPIRRRALGGWAAMRVRVVRRGFGAHMSRRRRRRRTRSGWARAASGSGGALRRGRSPVRALSHCPSSSYLRPSGACVRSRRSPARRDAATARRGITAAARTAHAAAHACSPPTGEGGIWTGGRALCALTMTTTAAVSESDLGAGCRCGLSGVVSAKKKPPWWETRKAAVRFLTVVLHQPASIDAILWRVDPKNSYVSTQFRILDVLIRRRFNKTLSGLVLPNGGGVSRVWPPNRKFQPCRPPLRSPKGRAWKVSSRARGRGQARAREAHSAPQASITHPTRRLVCPLDSQSSV